MTSPQPHSDLKKSLGPLALFAVAMGSVASQSSFVSVLNGAGIGGGAFLGAILTAFVLALCYAFTFLELALMMPKAGGLSTYTAVAWGHFVSIGVVLGGYVAVVPFGSAAELGLLQRVADAVYPGTVPHIGLFLIALFTVLNLLGIDIFASAQSVVVYVLMTSAVVIGIAGLWSDRAGSAVFDRVAGEFAQTGVSGLSLTVLALWSFAGLEYLCPMIEETRQPDRDVPRAMLAGAAALLGLYGLVALAAMLLVPSKELASSELPHLLLVSSLFGRSAHVIIVVFALTTSASILNAIIGTIPRMLYGMAHHGHVPAIFGRLHPSWKTPWFGILVVALLAAAPTAFQSSARGYVLVMLISATTFWLMAYIVAHINVMVLRRRYPERRRPFRTPLHPLPQLIGIAGMGYAIYNNAPTPEMARQVYVNGGIFFVAISAYSLLWVTFRMKKGIFEPEPMDQAISD